MNGEKITAQTIGETTAAAASNDPDARAKPIVAEAVSLFGQVVLILLKIIAGFIVFGLIMAACALIIGMFALIVGGEGFFTPPSSATRCRSGSRVWASWPRSSPSSC